MSLNTYKLEVLEFLADISKEVSVNDDSKTYNRIFSKKDIGVNSIKVELSSIFSRKKRVQNFEKELLDSYYGKCLDKAFDKILKREEFDLDQILIGEIVLTISFFVFLYL